MNYCHFCVRFTNHINPLIYIDSEVVIVCAMSLIISDHTCHPTQVNTPLYCWLLIQARWCSCIKVLRAASNVSLVMLLSTELYEITHCYLSPYTSEHTPVLLLLIQARWYSCIKVPRAASNVSLVMLLSTELYEITQCYLSPYTSEHTPLLAVNTGKVVQLYKGAEGSIKCVSCHATEY